MLSASRFEEGSQRPELEDKFTTMISNCNVEREPEMPHIPIKMVMREQFSNINSDGRKGISPVSSRIGM